MYWNFIPPLSENCDIFGVAFLKRRMENWKEPLVG